MPHIVEVDQSIRFDDTSDDTVLAYANGDHRSVLIPANVKRECLHELRARGHSTKTLYFQLFATGLYFLLKEHIQSLTRVVIDLEYMGRDAQIREHLINLLRREGKAIEAEQIQFAQIGKLSPAHDLGIDTLRRRKQPNQVLTVEDILGQFRSKRKRR